MTKVLIADDNRDMRYILRVQAELLGFTAVTAENGRDAVETAIVEKPDLILMDIMMPEMDGWEAIRLLRSVSETKNIPVLAVTAMFHCADLQTCIDVGSNDYIVKPFTWAELRAKITGLAATLPTSTGRA